ncbi:Helix-turn-helix domain protein [Mariniflexile rhizosphaerae]|uniref:helix-turn-helix domain-containing protein n=1 Tax=unclassified Mariniflexile TaxID=2643887 RepID=UPI000CC888E7|nr:helix-turn-helix domain-containing protein [Mariniflexile sp. TRM1-10]AXP81374.1 Helix-turn-helix domain protein [Mariniflexile sp. TRM1-10]PLB18526.1 MAG: Excisionase [Flavobacteriaceae bacterium FS1-H7996/R]
MEYFNDIKKPSKKEQIAAMKSYNALAATLEELHSENPEIEIEETAEKIRIPLKALKLLAKILEATSQGHSISVVPIATEMTTQAAAELLGCSRPHFVKLLEEGKIPFTLVGRHRRVKFEDVMDYKKEMKLKQERLLIDMMKSDEELGLYDS